MLAFDLGASSGRSIVGRFDGERLSVTETHRFPNDFVRVHNRLHWDILRLWHEIKQGLRATRHQGYDRLESLGIDTWGVDFGLLGRNGELLANPYHYRDKQTLGMPEAVEQLLPRAELFARTGIQFMALNTIYQLYAMRQANSPALEQAQTLLLIPDLLRYFLSGERSTEWTIASTSQLCNPRSRTWDRALIERLGLPADIFLPPIEPGTIAGSLLPSLCEEIAMPSLPVIAVGEHDTASAVAAVPADTGEFAYLSGGTWSLIGTEVREPVMDERALAFNVTNEGGVDGRIRLLKNVTGLWLIQECRRAWQHEGRNLSYTEEYMHIQHAAPFRSFINPDDPVFVQPQHMPRQIQDYCRQTGQPVPESVGELLRCIVESLALRYRSVLEGIEELVQKRYPVLHVVGGGAQHTILCQYSANALNRPVLAGPSEATAIGNIIVQLIALGHLKDLEQARRVVRASFPIQMYEPQDAEAWEQAYERYCTLS